MRIGLGMVLLAALLIAGAPCQRASAQQAQYSPTGDALFDRYAQAVLERSHDLALRPQGENPTTLPDGVLASWEKDFGADKRYWELRFWCAALRGFDPLAKVNGWGRREGGREADPEAGVPLLQKTWKRGVADGETLVILQDPQFRLWDAQQEAEQIGTGEDRYYSTSKFEPARPWVEITRDYEQRQLDFLSSAIKLSPDQAWPYWMRADYYLGLGEEELALADLRSGNAAPVCRVPAPFPVSFVLDNMEAGKSVGNEALAGALIVNAGRSELYGDPRGVRWRERSKEDVLRIALAGDTGITQELHRMACRMALAGRNNRYTYLLSASIVYIPSWPLLTDCGSGLSAEQRQTVLTVYIASNMVDTLERERRMEWWSEDPGLAGVITDSSNWEHLAFDLPSLLFSVVKEYPGTVGSVDYGVPHATPATLAKAVYRAMPGLFYRRFYEAWRGEDAWADKHYRRYFELLSLLDYSTLAKPDQWPPGPGLDW